MQHDVLIRRLPLLVTLTCLAAAAMVASSVGLFRYSSSIEPHGTRFAHGPYVEPGGLAWGLTEERRTFTA